MDSDLTEFSGELYYYLKLSGKLPVIPVKCHLESCACSKSVKGAFLRLQSRVTRAWKGIQPKRFSQEKTKRKGSPMVQ